MEVLQTDTPETLPLSDAELCALMMNLLDNAIHGACGTQKPLLRLDMHQKDGFFVFVCENSTAPDCPERSAKKKPYRSTASGLRLWNRLSTATGI